MLVDKILEHVTAKAANRPRSTSIGAYNVGRCRRLLWYHIRPEYETEPMQGRAELVFDLGDRIEDALMRFIAESGVAHVRLAREQDKTFLAEIGGNVWPDFFFEHEIDGKTQLVVGEIKSMADYSFERAEKGDLDESYLAQVECYMRAFDTQYALVLCYRKETSHLHEVIVERDDQRWAKVLMNVALARSETIPDRPYKLQELCEGCKGTGLTPTGRQAHKACGGTGKLAGGPYIPNFPCGYCSHKLNCWGELEMTVNDYGKPRWRLARKAA